MEEKIQNPTFHSAGSRDLNTGRYRGGTDPVLEAMIRFYDQMCRKWLLPHTQRGSSTSPSRARLAARGACTSKRAIWIIGNLSLEVLLFYQIPAQNRCLRYTYVQVVPPRTGNFTDFSRT